MPFTMPQKRRSLGGAATTASGSAPGAGGGAPAAPQAAPGYVDFSRILSANQPGAQKMANSLAGKAEQQGQAATSAIDSAKTGTSQQVQAGTLQYEKAKAPRSAEADPNWYREAGRVAGQKATQGYTGPKDWNAAGYNTADLATQAAKAGDTAKGLTTSGGRSALLRQDVRGPYSAGMSALDGALSGAALGNRGAELAGMYGGLSQRLIDYQGASGKEIAAAQGSSNVASGQYGTDAEGWTNYGNKLAQQQIVPEMLQAPAVDPRTVVKPEDPYDRVFGINVGRKMPKKGKGK